MLPRNAKLIREKDQKLYVRMICLDNQTWFFPNKNQLGFLHQGLFQRKKNVGHSSVVLFWEMFVDRIIRQRLHQQFLCKMVPFPHLFSPCIYRKIDRPKLPTVMFVTDAALTSIFLQCWLQRFSIKMAIGKFIIFIGSQLANLKFYYSQGNIH